nr:Protein Y55H10A.2 [Haemonchus contortus]
MNMYLYLAEGVIVCTSNGLLTLCIIGSRSNRKRREFLLIVSQGVADTMYAIAFMLIAVHRLHLEATAMLPYLVTALLVLINYALIWGDQSPTSSLCIASNGAAHPATYGVMLGIRLVANIGSACVYLAIVIYLTKSHGRSLQSLSAYQKKSHRNAKITLVDLKKGYAMAKSLLKKFNRDIPINEAQRSIYPVVSRIKPTA